MFRRRLVSQDQPLPESSTEGGGGTEQRKTSGPRGHPAEITLNPSVLTCQAPCLPRGLGFLLTLPQSVRAVMLQIHGVKEVWRAPHLAEDPKEEQAAAKAANREERPPSFCSSWDSGGANQSVSCRSNHPPSSRRCTVNQSRTLDPAMSDKAHL